MTSMRGNKYLNLVLTSTGVNYNIVIFGHGVGFRWRVTRSSDENVWWGEVTYDTLMGAYEAAWRLVLAPEAIGRGPPPSAA
jgi:hypothetical protein